MLTITQTCFSLLNGSGWNIVDKTEDRTVDSTEQDQTARMCRLVLTLPQTNPCFRVSAVEVF